MNMIMILCAKYLYLVVILIAVVYLFVQPRKRQKELLIFALVTLPLTYALAWIAGHLYYDPRPFVAQHITPLIPHAPTNGFPSDHTLITAALAAVLFPFNKKLGIASAVLALLVGVSRVYVHIHSPIDIVGSFVIAFAVAAVVYFSLRKFFRIGL